jgi:hypothetical protein
VRLAAVKQNPLGRGRLSGIDVSHDAEVAIVFDFILTRHDNSVRVFDRPASFEAGFLSGVESAGDPFGLPAVV